MNWYKIAKVENLTFDVKHIGSHHQQQDFNMYAITPDKKLGKNGVVGLLEYSEFRGEIYINHIIVAYNLRRQKIGTRMVEELKRINQGKIIHWGMMTDEGFALNQSLEAK